MNTKNQLTFMVIGTVFLIVLFIILFYIFGVTAIGSVIGLLALIFSFSSVMMALKI